MFAAAHESHYTCFKAAVAYCMSVMELPHDTEALRETPDSRSVPSSPSGVLGVSGSIWTSCWPAGDGSSENKPPPVYGPS